MKEFRFFAGLFLVLFVGLKLAGVIKWSWVFVLSPLWAPPVAIMALLFFVWARENLKSLKRRTR